MDFADFWADDELRRNTIATLVLVALILGGRLVALRTVHSFAAPFSETLRLRWASSVKQAALAIAIIGVMAIWSTELQAFAISIVAFTVAIVLATKELILCMSGSILRTSTGSFAIGDRIEVGDVRGDVIDHGLLTTTILETGPSHQRTGRSISVPNSVFLSQHVINETANDNYVLHTFRVPLDSDADWREAEKSLLGVAAVVCKEHVKPASRHLDAVSSQHGLAGSNVAPRVSLLLEDEGHVSLLLRVPAPAREKGAIEQGILRKFLEAQAE
jgi:small-conductance mechanosensitive channel